MRVDSAGASVVLTGSVPDAASLERAVNIARAHFPEKADGGIINLLTVGGNQQVMIEVTVSEINRDLRQEIGTNFAATITAQRRYLRGVQPDRRADRTRSIRRRHPS